MDQSISFVSNTDNLQKLLAVSQAVDAIQQAGRDVSPLRAVIGELASFSLTQPRRIELVQKASQTIVQLDLDHAPHLREAAQRAFDAFLNTGAIEKVNSPKPEGKALDSCTNSEHLRKFERARIRGSAFSILNRLGLVEFLGQDQTNAIGDCFLVRDQQGQFFVLKRYYDEFEKMGNSFTHAAGSLLIGLATAGISLLLTQGQYKDNANRVLRISQAGHGTKVLKTSQVIQNEYTKRGASKETIETDVYTLSEHFVGTKLSSLWSINCDWNEVLRSLVDTFQQMAERQYYYTSATLEGILLDDQTGDLRICDVSNFRTSAYGGRDEWAQQYLRTFDFFRKLIQLAPEDKRSVLDLVLNAIFEEVDLVRQFVGTSSQDPNYSKRLKECEGYLTFRFLREKLDRIAHDMVEVKNDCRAIATLLQINLNVCKKAYFNAIQTLSQQAPATIQNYQATLEMAHRNIERCWQELRDLQQEESERLKQLVNSPSFDREKQLSEANIEELRKNLQDAQKQYELVARTEAIVLQTPGNEIIAQLAQLLDLVGQSLGKFSTLEKLPK